MTKAIKKTIVTILLLCVAISFACFAACGKNTPDNPSNENRQEQQTNGENGQNDQNQTFPDNDNVPDIILSADGKSVIGLKNHNLTNLVISPSYNGVTVTSIGDSAFENCDSLMSVTIPDSVISIGERSFYDCDSLMSVTIGNNVASIGEYAFNYCYVLVEVINKSNLDITKGSKENGFIGYYALNVKTEGASDIVNKGDYLFYTYDNVNYLLRYEENETILILPENYNGQNYAIYKYAFSGCDSLVSVTIPDSVTNIGGSAFFFRDVLEEQTDDCSFVSHYRMNKLVEVINKSSLNITKGSDENGGIGYHALNVKSEGTSEIVNKDDYLFYTCENVNYLVGYVGNDTEITLPENYNGQNYEIYECAFYKCDSLTNVTIPDCVTSIGRWAFHDCDSLMSVTIGNGVTKIGNTVLNYCSSLRSITIGENVTSIGNYAFYYCKNLVEVINKSNLNITKGSKDNGHVGYYAINVKTSGESDVKKVGDYFFYTCNNVNYLLDYVGNETQLTLPQGYNGKNYVIYKEAFLNGSLTSVTIPNSVTSIGESAFEDCRSLTSITIGDNVKEIGDAAFEDCRSLTSVIISDSVTSIGRYTFRSCVSLMSVTIGENVASIGIYAFDGCNKLVEVINKSSLDITKNSWGNGSVEAHALKIKKSGESEIVNKNGYYFYTYGVENYLMGYICNTTELTLPNNYNGQNYSIYKYAFYGCSRLTSIIIPDSVTSIENQAFYGCSSLKSITISNSVTSIGENAFNYCSSIENIYYNGDINDWVQIEGLSNLMGHGKSKNLYLNGELLTEANITTATKINGSAFEGCDSLTSVTIENSVTSIGDDTFYDCSSLTIVMIGNSVTSIGWGAFYGCDSLTNVTFENPNGWYISKYSSDKSGTNLMLTNVASNATYLKSTYYNYYWKRG